MNVPRDPYERQRVGRSRETQGLGLDRLEAMQTFVRIVEAGSLSAAAAQLNSTQPTVSRRLQGLEKLLGVRLLQRTTHSMKLTEDGQRCYAHAKALLEHWAALEADLGGVKDTPRGHLRVVVPHAFGQELLVAPLVEFMQAHPEVTVDWLLHDAPADFIAAGIDCSVRVGEVDEPGLVAVRLAEVPRILVAAPSIEPPRSIEDLGALPWLALPRFYRDTVTLLETATGRTARVPIQPRFCSDSLYAVRSAARAGLGAAVVSAWVVTEDVAAGRLQRLLPGWEAPPLPVYLVYPYAPLYPARLRTFVDAMKRALPGMPGTQLRAPKAPKTFGE